MLFFSFFSSSFSSSSSSSSSLFFFFFFFLQLQFSFLLIASDNEFDPYILQQRLGTSYTSQLAFWNDRGLALFAVSNAANKVELSWFTPSTSGALLPNYFVINETPALSSLNFGVSLEYVS